MPRLLPRLVYSPCLSEVSETLATIVIAAIGIMFLCFASVVLALRMKGERSITWSGFGVEFRVSPCQHCKYTKGKIT